jgi:VCBS repeat-containing protein
MHARNYDQEHGFIRPSEVDFTRLNERGIDLSGRGFVRSNEHEFPAFAGLAPAINQAPTLTLGSQAQVELGTRAETPASLTAFESLMGTPAGGILGFADDSTPEYSLARVQADAPEFEAMERPVNWAIPLAWDEVSMADVAAGKHDATFIAMAETIAEHQTEDINPLLYVRPGWEANNEYPWKISSGPDNAFDPKLADDYVDAFQHVATLFRSVDDRFRIEWNQNYSKADANGVFYDLKEIYPGDDYVDVVGVDAYNVARFSGQDDPVTAWDYKADAPFGLNWFSDFAAAHGKPLALTEWGIDSDNFGSYADELAEFVRTNNVIYTNYWNADARTNGDDTLTDGSKPATAAAIADAFGPEGNSTLIPGKQSGLIVEAGTDAEGAALAGTASARIWAVASDPDVVDRVTFDTTGWNAIDATHFEKNGVYGSAVLDTGAGVITYTLDNARDATDALTDTDSVTDDFSVTVRDRSGATATQTAQFAIEGANDAIYSGEAGNDVSDLDNAGEQVAERAAEATDTVRTGFPHLLGDNIEKLELSHAGDAWGIGKDILSGGADSFVFDTPPDPRRDADVIADFDPTLDRFELDQDVFRNSPAGELAASAFVTDRSASADDHVIYDGMTGALFYDSDGGADHLQCANLTPLLVPSSDDFFFV